MDAKDIKPTVTKAPSDVEEVEVDIKALFMYFDEDGVPHFDFTGDGWTGRDIPIIVKLLPKAYYNHKREARRSKDGRRTKTTSE